jgi:hypothetical protein
MADNEDNHEVMQQGGTSDAEAPIDGNNLDQEATLQVSASGTSVDCVYSPVNVKDSLNDESDYHKTCRETGLTANPFANIAERSRSNERERLLELSVIDLTIADTHVQNKPPAKRPRATTPSPKNSDDKVIIVHIATDNKTKHVSFAPKQEQKEPALMYGPPNNPTYQVVEEAAPAWRSSTSHRGLEQKAKLRYEYIRQQLDSGNFPSWTYGLEKFPTYLQPLSVEMISLAKTHARAVGELAAVELLNTVNAEKKLADDHLIVTNLMYERIGNVDFTKAEERQAQVIGGYRTSERKKLVKYAQRETKRRPANNEELGKLMASRTSRCDMQGRDDRDSSPEEARPSSRGPPKKKWKGPKSNQGKPKGPPPNPSSSCSCQAVYVWH